MSANQPPVQPQPQPNWPSKVPGHDSGGNRDNNPPKGTKGTKGT